MVRTLCQPAQNLGKTQLTLILTVLVLFPRVMLTRGFFVSNGGLSDEEVSERATLCEESGRCHQRIQLCQREEEECCRRWLRSESDLRQPVISEERSTPKMRNALHDVHPALAES